MNLARRFVARMLFAAAAAVLVGTASATGPTPAGNAPADPGPGVVEFLLSTATNEFRPRGESQGISFRQVRVGYFSEAGQGRFVLCGSFKSGKAQDSDWVQFASIQTSPYEQWFGGVAESICASRKMKLYSGEYSSELLKRVAG